MCSGDIKVSNVLSRALGERVQVGVESSVHSFCSNTEILVLSYFSTQQLFTVYTGHWRLTSALVPEPCKHLPTWLLMLTCLAWRGMKLWSRGRKRWQNQNRHRSSATVISRVFLALFVHFCYVFFWSITFTGPGALHGCKLNNILSLPTAVSLCALLGTELPAGVPPTHLTPHIHTPGSIISSAGICLTLSPSLLVLVNSFTNGKISSSRVRQIEPFQMSILISLSEPQFTHLKNGANNTLPHGFIINITLTLFITAVSSN